MCALVAGVQTCALPIFQAGGFLAALFGQREGDQAWIDLVRQVGPVIEGEAHRRLVRVHGAPSILALEIDSEIDAAREAAGDDVERKSVVEGKGEEVGVELGGSSMIKRKIRKSERSDKQAVDRKQSRRREV